MSIKTCRKDIIVIVIIILIFGLKVSANAEKVRLRYSLDKDVLKIVLQTETDKFVNDANIISSYTLLKIEFPDEFILQVSQSDTDVFYYHQKDNNLYIKTKGLKKVKVNKLTSPPRIVLNIYLYTDETIRRGILPAVIIKKIKKIVIDPGHGGRDYGIYTPSFTEKKITLKIATSLQKTFKEKKVFLTRTDDRYVSIMNRIFYIRKKKPDLMISIHMNMSKQAVIYTDVERKPNNEEIYMLSYSQHQYIKYSKGIGRLIGETLMKKLHIKVLYKYLPLPILSYISSPAIIVELPSADFFDYNPQNINKIAKAIVEAINKYEKEF